MRKIIICFYFFTLFNLNSEVILMNDGSILKCDILDVLEEKIIVKTDYSEEISINRSSINKIYLDENQYKNDNKKQEIININELNKINKDADKIKNKYFIPGFIVSIMSPISYWFINFSSIPSGTYFITLPLSAGLSIAFGGLGTIPYGGPIAVAGVSLILGIAFSTFSTMQGGGYPFYLSLSISSLATAGINAIAIALQFYGGYLKKKYIKKMTENSDFSFFIFPEISDFDFNDITINCGIIIKIL